MKVIIHWKLKFRTNMKKPKGKEQWKKKVGNDLETFCFARVRNMEI